ncbi:MAG: 3-phosphoshikimate 1-carboxyvinyltransferase [Candidatus Zixiibacteriota bacterium]|nr:MAG: 3-phosphoshikimate 1-carboxyvinyltransferase [candidate division Zixibacteria bacterium]
MKLTPSRRVNGSLRVPGDKSIAHRAALVSILAGGPITVRNFPDNDDCRRSLEAARACGVTVEQDNDILKLTPPETLPKEDITIDAGNSGTTTRLLAGLAAGSSLSMVITGDESLSKRPMKRIVEPLSSMGAEVIDTEGHLPLTIHGKKLLPFEYRLPIPSAQVKSSLLLAGQASGCSVVIKEDIPSRNHTEVMLKHLGANIEIIDIKPELVDDPRDPRRKRRVRREDYRTEIRLSPGGQQLSGEVDIPGDISTAAFFFAAAAITGGSVTVRQVGLNPTRTGILQHLKNVGCGVEITNRAEISGEKRGDVTVTGAALKGRKISGETTVALIDELPVVAVLAAFAEGTTVIRDAGELRVKESDRLQAIADNLQRMGVKVGLLPDGLAIEGGGHPQGADFVSYGDHRIAMAFSVAALAADGPSTIDDPSIVSVSCPEFYTLLTELIS